MTTPLIGSSGIGRDSRRHPGTRDRLAKQPEGCGDAPAEPPPWLSWIESHPYAVILILIALVLLPFVGKPFHLDDPMYLWAGRHIVRHPLDFYGLNVAWTGTIAPMWWLNQNPPLTSYFIALATTLVGGSEVALHAAFLVPATLALVGTWQCSRLYTRWPVLATVLTGVMPVFALCGTTIMADMMMLSFWVWAVALWETGLRQRRWGWLLAAGLGAGLGILTKYPAINLLPLLGLAVIVRRAPLRYLLALLIPVAMVVCYDLMTRELYGTGLFSQAMGYARGFAERHQRLPARTMFTALCFTGGCLAPVALLLPWVAGRRPLIAGAIIGAAVFATVLWTGWPSLASETVDGLSWPTPPGFALQVAAWATVGAGVVWLAVIDALRHRDADAFVLAAWMLGIICFAGLFNWSVNGRTLLPLAPVAGILLTRALDSRLLPKSGMAAVILPATLAAAGAFAVTINAADFSLAAASRRAAEDVAGLAQAEGRRLWFQGHWGFQHYCQENGGLPFLHGASRTRPGDILVTPLYGSNVRLLGEPWVSTLAVTNEPLMGGLSVMHPLTGAAFYTDVRGPLPFVIGPVPDERFLIQEVEDGPAPSTP
jgi:4-amino-4-deoxy-L-arabinose transferase-like glycosyltransferase